MLETLFTLLGMVICAGCLYLAFLEIRAWCQILYYGPGRNRAVLISCLVLLVGSYLIVNALIGINEFLSFFIVSIFEIITPYYPLVQVMELTLGVKHVYNFYYYLAVFSVALIIIIIMANSEEFREKQKTLKTITE